MFVETRDSGEIEVFEEDIVNFSQPLFGFENYKSFALISENNTEGYLIWLQSVEEAQLCFILLKPEAFKIDFEFELADEYLALLDDGEYEVWLVAVIKDNFEESTVNLRSPIIINRNNHKAVQAMLDSSYPVRNPVYSV